MLIKIYCLKKISKILLGGLIGVANAEKNGLMARYWSQLIASKETKFRLFSLDISKPCYAVIEVVFQSAYGNPNIYRYSFMRNGYYDEVQKKKAVLFGEDSISPILLNGNYHWDIYANFGSDTSLCYIRLIAFYNINLYWSEISEIPTGSIEF